MTYAAPHSDAYDDGLVHSHDWSTTATPPGCHHRDGRRASPTKNNHEHDDGLVHNHHWARS